MYFCVFVTLATLCFVILCFFGEGMHSTECHLVFICTTLTTLNVAKETNKLKQITTFYRPH